MQARARRAAAEARRGLTPRPSPGKNAPVDFHFETEVRVRFAETDAQGIAHNAVYLVWFEVARVEYLAASAAATRACGPTGSRR